MVGAAGGDGAGGGDSVGVPSVKGELWPAALADQLRVTSGTGTEGTQDSVASWMGKWERAVMVRSDDVAPKRTEQSERDAQRGGRRWAEGREKTTASLVG